MHWKYSTGKKNHEYFIYHNIIHQHGLNLHRNRQPEEFCERPFQWTAVDPKHFCPSAAAWRRRKMERRGMRGMREVEAEEGGGEEKRARKDEDGSKSGSSVKRYTRSWSTPTQKKERKKKVVEKWKTELFFFSLCQGLCFCLFIFILVVTVQLNMRLKHIICVFKRILIICLFKHIHMMCARMWTSLYVWRKKWKSINDRKQEKEREPPHWLPEWERSALFDKRIRAFHLLHFSLSVCLWRKVLHGHHNRYISIGVVQARPSLSNRAEGFITYANDVIAGAAGISFVSINI